MISQLIHQVKELHLNLDTANLTISTGIIIPTILQYYSTENNKSHNSNGLPVNFGSNSYLILAPAKVGLFTQNY